MIDLKRLVIIVGVLSTLNGCATINDQPTCTSMTDVNTRLELLISKINNREFFN